MEDVAINRAVVFIGGRGYCSSKTNIAQVLLTEAEQQMVIGFISLLMKSSGKKIKVVENTQRDILALCARNTSWENIESTIENYNKTAKEKEEEIKDKVVQ